MSQRQIPVDFGVLPFSSSSQEPSFSGRNKYGSPTSRFDSLPHHQRVKLLLAEAFAKKMEWTGVRWNSDRTRVLDYGCGSGLISQILAPYVKQVIGVDPSEAMVMEYNHKAANQRMYPSRLRAVQGDLTMQRADPRLETAELYNFDVAIVGPGFHQIPNPQYVLMHLCSRLKTGGVLLILDSESPYQGYPSAAAQYRQYGFSRTEMHSLLEGAHMSEVGVMELIDSEGRRVVIDDVQGHVGRNVVLAKGRRLW